MSLTSFLHAKENQEVRNKLKTDFSRPFFSLKTEIQAPPLTNNYGIVGTAFDYLFRYKVKSINQSIQFEEGHWVSTIGYKRLQNWLQKNTKKGNSHLLKEIAERYDIAQKSFTLFCENGEVNNLLLESSIFLAKLDMYQRIGFLEDFEVYNPIDIYDLMKMLSIMDTSKFQIRKQCWLNPIFIAPTIIGGADGDIIIDDTLIDIKTTKNLKLERSYLNQLICYYVLSLMKGINGKKSCQPIKKLGIYFARFGELWTVPVYELGNSDQYHAFCNWLTSYCRNDGLDMDTLDYLISNLHNEE